MKSLTCKFCKFVERTGWERTKALLWYLSSCRMIWQILFNLKINFNLKKFDQSNHLNCIKLTSIDINQYQLTIKISTSKIQAINNVPITKPFKIKSDSCILNQDISWTIITKLTHNLS